MKVGRELFLSDLSSLSTLVVTGAAYLSTTSPMYPRSFKGKGKDQHKTLANLFRTASLNIEVFENQPIQDTCKPPSST